LEFFCRTLFILTHSHTQKAAEEERKKLDRKKNEEFPEKIFERKGKKTRDYSKHHKTLRFSAPNSNKKEIRQKSPNYTHSSRERERERPKCRWKQRERREGKSNAVNEGDLNL